MTVTGCEDCPLRQSDCDVAFKYYYECGHPQEGTNGWDVPEKGPAPSWCPLRTAPLTIAMEGQGVLTSIPVVESKAMPEGTASLVGANGIKG